MGMRAPVSGRVAKVGSRCCKGREGRHGGKGYVVGVVVYSW